MGVVFVCFFLSRELASVPSGWVGGAPPPLPVGPHRGLGIAIDASERASRIYYRSSVARRACVHLSQAASPWAVRQVGGVARRYAFHSTEGRQSLHTALPPHHRAHPPIGESLSKVSTTMRNRELTRRWGVALCGVGLVCLL